VLGAVPVSYSTHSGAFAGAPYSNRMMPMNVDDVKSDKRKAACSHSILEQLAVIPVSPAGSRRTQSAAVEYCVKSNLAAATSSVTLLAPPLPQPSHRSKNSRP
jgi:hypothetical protein